MLFQFSYALNVFQVNRAKELVTAEAELTHKLRERHNEDSSRKHTLYTDRQQLLEAAQREGQETNLPEQRPRWNDHGVSQPMNGKF